MLRRYRHYIAKWMIARRRKQVRILSSAGLFLPLWLIPAAIAIYFVFGYPMILILPVLIVGRYFVAHRTGDAVIGKISDVVRLRQPLAQALANMGTYEPGLVGIRLQTIGELLEQGASLTEALTLALPEISPRRLGAIAIAETDGVLPTVLARQASPSERWNMFAELDTSMLVYFGLLLFGWVLAMAFLERFLSAAFRSWYAHYATGDPLLFWPFFLPRSFVILAVLATVAYLGPIFLDAILLRRLFFPFFRPTGWFRYCQDAFIWHFLILGRLFRSKAWAAAAQVLAEGFAQGAPLNECCNRAATATGNRVARHRLRRWGRLMAAGADPAAAARKAHLPKIMCNALAMPGELSGTGMHIVMQYFDFDYRRIMGWVRAASIPVAVLIGGLLVLEVALMLYTPYAAILGALCRSVR